MTEKEFVNPKPFTVNEVNYESLKKIVVFRLIASDVFSYASENLDKWKGHPQAFRIAPPIELPKSFQPKTDKQEEP